jgi:hypothetical protein
MPLNDLQKQKIAEFIPIFRNYLAASDRLADLQVREERVALFSELLSPEGITRMAELEFGRVISSLWSFAMWGNQSYLVSKLLQDNPIDELKEKLNALLWGDEPLAVRYDSFRNQTHGFGSASITELLTFAHPNECGLWNNKARQALKLLGFSQTFPNLNTYQINGSQYIEFNYLLCEIRDELTQYDLGELDLLGVDYFLFEVHQSGTEYQEPMQGVAPMQEQERVEITDFDHDEAIDQLLTIGQWLGFEIEKEKLISPGSKVDVVWQARVANLGVVTYVFEVQRHGNRDGLIINLMNAQNNPTVQRLVIVALLNELEQIKLMVENLPENFRRIVGYMNVAELFRAADLVTELSGIISKLELVKSEFGG